MSMSLIFFACTDMSSRPHGRGMRGGHHQHQHHGGYGHRGGQWMHKGGNRGNRSDYHHQHNHGGGRSPRPGMRHADPEKLLASLGPDAQLALTTAIINTVLKTSVSGTETFLVLNVIRCLFHAVKNLKLCIKFVIW